MFKKTSLLLSILVFCCAVLNAQKVKPRLKNIPLNSLDAFQSVTPNWKIVGDVQGSYADTLLQTANGSGMLFNNYTKEIQNKAKNNLFTKMEHGDMILEMDVMIPKGSNAGIYLQSRYEVQIFDSWGVKIPKSTDMGGIYERSKDNKDYEGKAPLQNSSLAPGLWQHLEISFQAPRFDAAGNKTMQAKFNYVKLNGIILHENIYVSGPTISAAAKTEVAYAPLMIQGDHGMIAIKNIKYVPQDDLKVTLSNINYAYYEQSAKTPEEANKTKPTSQGTTRFIDSRLASAKDNYYLEFNGKMNVPEKNTYTFTMLYSGDGSLEIDGSKVIVPGWTWVGADPVYGTVELSAGEHTFKIWVHKDVSWARSGLSLYIERPNSRALALHTPASIPERTPAPLIAVRVEKDPEMVRSFMNHGNKKLTHVLSVGDPAQVSYSYDLMQGGLMQVWRGEFLNTTDMWHERGEPQTASPLGAPIVLSGKSMIYEKTNLKDSISDIIYKGYILSDARLPIFNYEYKALKIQDVIVAAEKGRGLTRTITVSGEGKEKQTIRIAQSSQITPLGGGLYSLGDQAYYIQVSPAAFPRIESFNGTQVMLLSASEPVQYSIIW